MKPIVLSEIEVALLMPDPIEFIRNQDSYGAHILIEVHLWMIFNMLFTIIHLVVS